MREYVLYRFADGPDGTVGILRGPMDMPAPHEYATLEEEDQGNARNISRIPAGTYVCKRSRYYAGGYDTFEITGVPQRSRILFHIGNTEEDTAGCVMVGTRHGVLRVRDEDTQQWRTKAAVIGSKLAFGLFMFRTGVDREFRLTIHDPGHG